MSARLIKLLAPAVLLLAAGTASAGHGGGHSGGHGGHGGHGHHSGFHTVHHSHSYHHYSSYGYGGYYYPSYGYSYPSYGYYPNGYYTVPTVAGSGIIPANGYYPTPSAVAAPATVTVIVPEGAQLWFDGKDVTGTDHVFTSAILQPNQSGVLSVKGSWGGSTYSMQLVIRAGDKLRVDLR